jgi:hypothetical protein
LKRKTIIDVKKKKKKAQVNDLVVFGYLTIPWGCS